MATPGYKPKFLTPEELQERKNKIGANPAVGADPNARIGAYTQGVFDPSSVKSVEQTRIDNATNGYDPATGTLSASNQRATANIDANQVVDSSDTLNSEDYQQYLLDRVAEARTEADRLAAEDETATKSERSRKHLGAIADAIAGVANMWGVSKGAYNQENPKSYSMISESIVRDRNRRKVELDRANTRLDTLYGQLANYRMRQQSEDRMMLNAQTRAKNVERLNQKMMQDYGIKSDKSALEWAKLEEKAREFDKDFDRKSWKDQQDILVKLAMIDWRYHNTDTNNATKIATSKGGGSATPVSTLLASPDWNASKDALFKSVYGEGFDRSKATPEQKREYDELTQKKNSIESFLQKHPEATGGIGAPASPTTPTTPATPSTPATPAATTTTTTTTTAAPWIKEKKDDANKAPWVK